MTDTKDGGPAQKALDELLEIAMSMTGWSREEARNFMSCISADSPEALFEAIPDALEIAHRAEIIVAGVDLMKRMGAVINAQVQNGELAWRFHPDAKIKTFNDVTGERIEIDFAPIGARAPKEK